MINTSLANRYTILEEIGSGGMGVVYKGWDTRHEQLVAVKQLRPELVQNQALARFKREGEILRRLNHPNIVNFFLMAL